MSKQQKARASAAPSDFEVPTLGPARFDSPLLRYRDREGRELQFVDESERILVDHRLSAVARAAASGAGFPSFELAGPRRKIFFDPARTSIGIVTCGGLCPGLNNVIRSIVMAAEYHYGVRRIYGFRYGYRGLVEPGGHIELDSERVSEIHTMGGSILASSRGEQDVPRSVERLRELGVGILFLSGGDGTMRGGLDLADEIRRRGLPIAVVGIPKTIDNDLEYMDRTFGFVTAYSQAVQAIDGAHRESQGAPNGVGLVKVMGRHSGFIAAAAALASGCVNFVLIPEVPFRLEGAGGFLEILRDRIARRGHAVIVVAEGAGQDLMGGGGSGRDASGNVKLEDIGLFLGDRIKRDFAARGLELNLKYIDPSYIVRSVPASPTDAVLCSALGLDAVHAGMAGKTEMTVGLWHRAMVNIPIRRVIESRNTVDPRGPLWLAVLGATGQPPSF